MGRNAACHDAPLEPNGRRRLGNFCRHVWCATVLVLPPLSAIMVSLLILAGMPMTLDGATVAHTLEGATQTIVRGPVAAMVTIKQLGINGGGFSGPNCTHPFENPGFWSNVLGNVAVILIPMATVSMFVHIIGRTKHATMVFGVMLVLYAGFVAPACCFESQPTAAVGPQ